MANNLFVLDTSALITFIEKEPGAERVRQVIREETIIIPWIVLLEVVYISERELGKLEAHTRYAMLKSLNARFLWEADESTLLTAANIKSHHRLSLADSIIAAITIQHHATLLHKDPEYTCLHSKLMLEPLPFKLPTS
jgi:predicted nucleic acid-binding protein